MKINKTILKAFLLASFIVSSVTVKSQEENNKPRRWGIELQGSKHYVVTSVGADLLHRNNKNCFFAGLGIGFDKDNHTTNPIIKTGYRRYTGKALSDFRFYYQTFLYYSTLRNYNSASKRYLTANFGIGIEYWFFKEISAGFSTNYGVGYNFISKSIIFSGFPVQLTLGYKF